MEFKGSFLDPSPTGERGCSQAVVMWWDSEADRRPLALMSDGEGRSCVGLRGTFLGLVGGGGGAGLGF